MPLTDIINGNPFADLIQRGVDAGYLNPDPLRSLRGTARDAKRLGEIATFAPLQAAQGIPDLPPLAAGLGGGLGSLAGGGSFLPAFRQASTEQRARQERAVPGLTGLRQAVEGGEISLNPEGDLGKTLALAALPGGVPVRGKRAEDIIQRLPLGPRRLRQAPDFPHGITHSREHFNPAGARVQPDGSFTRGDVTVLPGETVDEGFDLVRKTPDGELDAGGALLDSSTVAPEGFTGQKDIVSVDVHFFPKDTTAKAQFAGFKDRADLQRTLESLGEFFPSSRFVSGVRATGMRSRGKAPIQVFPIPGRATWQEAKKLSRELNSPDLPTLPASNLPSPGGQ